MPVFEDDTQRRPLPRRKRVDIGDRGGDEVGVGAGDAPAAGFPLDLLRPLRKGKDFERTVRLSIGFLELELSATRRDGFGRNPCSRDRLSLFVDDGTGDVESSVEG